MKKLLVYLKGYERETVLAPLFKMLEAIFELFVPLVMAAVIDTGIGGANESYVIRMCLVLVALGVVGLVCSITAQFYAAKAATGFSAELRKELFAHIQSLSYREMDAVGSSTLITRMTSDVNQIQAGVNLVLRLFLRSPFIVFGAMVMAFTVDTKAALVFVVAIPLLSAVVFGLMLYTMPLYRQVQGALDKILGITRENLHGVRVLRAFHKEGEEEEAFRKSNEALTIRQKFVGRISGLMNPVTYIIVNAAVIALLHIGAIQVDTGVLTQGEVVALVNYMSQILVELVKLANLIITVTKAIACGNRVQGIFEIHTSLTDGVGGKAASGGGVVFSQVGMSYEAGASEALSDITFNAKPGDTIGIIGGTGSGKTTLVNLIPRFYEATRGEILVDGMDVKNYPIKELRQKIGMVPQKAVLFAGTIAENLRWGKEDAGEEELWQALSIAQAKDFVQEKKKGLNSLVAQDGRNFSGGQRQRLTIARALVGNPSILILDDSASALDFATDAKLRQALRKLPGGPVVFIVSQRTSSIMHADTIVVLEDGKAAGIGTHEELLETCQVYQEIYQSQFRKEEA